MALASRSCCWRLDISNNRCPTGTCRKASADLARRLGALPILGRKVHSSAFNASMLSRISSLFCAALRWRQCNKSRCESPTGWPCESAKSRSLFAARSANARLCTLNSVAGGGGGGGNSSGSFVLRASALPAATLYIRWAYKEWNSRRSCLGLKRISKAQIRRPSGSAASAAATAASVAAAISSSSVSVPERTEDSASSTDSWRCEASPAAACVAASAPSTAPGSAAASRMRLSSLCA
mmetsp:Transcript_74007/g.214407  ORF Transcript_74007/g.214407 Transcript_74007/m.214407 type:complete len:238 (-) Transcript_74007:1197-1910(-)